MTRAPVAPASAATVFGPQLSRVERFAELLADAGVVRGLLGPREVPELWNRHLLNCAVLAPLVPAQARVVDVGSGAGLPGVVLGLQRPDVRLTLIEPLARRCAFLSEVIEELSLASSVEVVRGRAEDPEVRRVVGLVDVVTARAVAPLERLVRWCLPLVRPGGELLAMKGARAVEELRAARGSIARLGGDSSAVEHVGDGDSATHVVRVTVRAREHPGRAVPGRRAANEFRS